ncbi:MAG: DUF423 domain-containing protein [Candidatus Hinthialibacter antarcticus]|nr:DUF423 domain-containing protein [Candidatus Hinthialibacter antarcticus]
MERIFALTGAIFGFLGVGFGAFGAHALKDKLDPYFLDVFEVGVRYQMYHALALLFVAWAASRAPGLAVQIAGWGFILGTLIFSGSLYILALSGIRWLGAITPIGGVGFLVGWAALLVAFIKMR